jgi:hypothetical protein
VSPRRGAEEGGKPISLQNVAVDVKTRLGALTLTTQTGLPASARTACMA